GVDVHLEPERDAERRGRRDRVARRREPDQPPSVHQNERRADVSSVRPAESGAERPPTAADRPRLLLTAPRMANHRPAFLTAILRRAFAGGRLPRPPHRGGPRGAGSQYVPGLRNPGYAFFLVEPIPPSSLRPAGTSLTASINAGYFRDVAARFGLTSRAALLR